MNIDQAIKTSDHVAQISKSNAMHNAANHCLNTGELFTFYEPVNPAGRATYNVVHRIEGLPGVTNFYLKKAY